MSIMASQLLTQLGADIVAMIVAGNSVDPGWLAVGFFLGGKVCRAGVFLQGEGSLRLLPAIALAHISPNGIQLRVARDQDLRLDGKLTRIFCALRRVALSAMRRIAPRASSTSNSHSADIASNTQLPVLVRRRHDPSAQVREWLRKVVQGYYQYHAVPGNLGQLSVFRHRLCRLCEPF
jgi:hypothetical protein